MTTGTSATKNRTVCNVCGDSFDDRTHRLVPVRCNVRKFADEVFHMWRCTRCRCMHCWEIVDLDRYYEGYGTHRQKLDLFLRLAYREQLRRFRKAGLKPEHRLLDYGCGSGLLVAYLKTRGYANVTGYDPYGRPEGLEDGSVLRAGAYDFICSQDVIEHVEEPGPFIARLTGLLRPGGALLIGMPSADTIDLARTHKHLHQLHAPYHLHIYTKDALVRLAAESNLEPIVSFNRYYVECPLFGMNEAFLRRYLELGDDTIDALVDPPRVGAVLRSPKLLFHGTFGYLYSPRHSIAVAFRKPA